MATSLGGTVLADPAYGREGYQQTEIDSGAIMEMHDGSIVLDYVGSRYHHRLTWNGITYENCG